MFWLGAIVSLCYVPGITGAFIATQWPALSILLLPVLWKRGPFTWAHAVGAVFLLYAALHVPFSPLPRAGVFGLWLVAIMGLSVWFGSTKETLHDLYAGLAVGGAASSFVAVLQYFGYPVVVVMSNTPAGIYVNGVQQGAVLALLIVALATERMWLWVLPLVPGLALCGSRGAWLALAVGLIGCHFRRLWVFGLVGAFGLLVLTGPFSSSDLERVFIWHVALQNLTWFGYGPGIFYTLMLTEDGHLLIPEYAHNDLLQLVFEYGAMALLPVAIFAVVIRRTEAREWPIILAFATLGCYSFPLWMPITSFLGLAAAGRILRDHAVARGYRSDSGLDGFSWRPWARREVVPVASYHSAGS